MKTHYIYKITNHTTGEYYYGKRTFDGHWKDDTYMGSGTLLANKMNKHPDHDWRKEVLLIFDTEAEAYEHEVVVIGDRWRDDPLCLNLCVGGAIGARWDDPEWRKQRSEQSKDRWRTDDEYRAACMANITERASAGGKAVWDNRRDHMTKKRQDYWRSAEGRKYASERAKNAWSDNTYRERMVARRREIWDDPSHRERHRVANDNKPATLVDLNGDKVKVPHDQVPDKLREGYTFYSKAKAAKDRKVSIRSMDGRFYIRRISFELAKKALLANADWRLGGSKKNTQLTRDIIDPLTGLITMPEDV